MGLCFSVPRRLSRRRLYLHQPRYVSLEDHPHGDEEEEEDGKMSLNGDGGQRQIIVAVPHKCLPGIGKEGESARLFYNDLISRGVDAQLVETRTARNVVDQNRLEGT